MAYINGNTVGFGVGILSAIPEIGENGNWYIGTQDTGKPSCGAAGEDGPQGTQGERGPCGLLPTVALPWASVITLPANREVQPVILQGDTAIVLGEPEAGYANEWVIMLTQGEKTYAVTLPEIQWSLGIAPTLAANTTTEIRLYYKGDVLQGVWN